MKEKYYLVPLAAIINIVLVYTEQRIWGGTPNFYLSVFISIFNSVLCYGVVLFRTGDNSIWKQPGKKLSFEDVIRSFLAAIFVVIACYYFQNLYFNLAYSMTGYVPEKYMNLSGNVFLVDSHHTLKETVIMCLAFGVVIPIYEEIFFRGLLYNSYPKVSGFARFLITNICFLLSHEEADLMIFILPMSIACMLCAAITGGIIASCILHCVVNIIGILKIPVGEFVFSPKYPIRYQERGVAVTNSFFCFIIVLIAVIVISRLLRFQDYKKVGSWDMKNNVGYVIAGILYLVFTVFVC